MIYNNFSDLYKKVLINTENKIKELGYKELNEVDIFISIITNSTGGIKEIFNLYGINENLVLELLEIKEIFGKQNSRAGVYSGMTNSLKETILLSVKIAASFSKPKASIEDFLLALINNNGWFVKLLDYVGINPKDVEKNLKDLNQSGAIDGLSSKSGGQSFTEPLDKIIGAIADNLFGGIMNNEEVTPFDNNKNSKKVESNTPALDFFSTDLTLEAKEKKLDKVIGRNDEVQRLLSILNRKTKNNPVLVGEPGVGKTAIVELLAQMIVDGKVPFSMKDKKLLALDMSSLVAGTKYRGEFEARIKQIIEEASKVENEIILFIDEIHTIIGAGGAEGTLDASNILKPAMGRGKIRVIGATTLNEYQKYIEKDSALERRFQKIVVGEPNFEDAISIISGLKETFEEYHNLNITKDAVVGAVELSNRYITDRYLPDKAIDLIDEACSLKSMTYSGDEEKIKSLKEKVVETNKQIESFVMSQQYKKASALKEKIKKLEEDILSFKKKYSIPKKDRLNITKKDIQKVLSMTTGIPVYDLEETEIDKLKKLPNVLGSQIIGQSSAIESVCNSIMRSKAGISNPNKPLGSFLFLGPTGVGKTELVKVLTKEFYGNEENLIKIDMSEYSDKTGVSKLIGANAGYVGYEEGGQLTEKVRKKPYSIVLFDEIEKGDFEVYNLLLQILDEGSLTDNKGRKINFKNTIIIMTSNVGQEEFNKEANKIGFDLDDKKEKDVIEEFKKVEENIKANLTDYFSKEFLNRIDKIIVFGPLDKKSISKIVEINLEELKQRIKKAKNIDLAYDKKVINFIAKEVYNPEYGAREVKRYIIEKIEDKIAQNLIYGKASDTISISLNNKELVIK
ncbi:MAG: ATP-dependent Clp protease ATP-binding subunit [Candidatus Gracilibacteria bacterium]|nr:ATP-dependent Clp protease ATP-binding subunit [Candidatus Gracilibacteria bacterium]